MLKKACHKKVIIKLTNLYYMSFKMIQKDDILVFTYVNFLLDGLFLLKLTTSKKESNKICNMIVINLILKRFLQENVLSLVRTHQMEIQDF